MNRAHEIESAASAALDFLDELQQFSDTPARRTEAKKHAEAIRWALTLAPPSVGVMVPTFRDFVLWNDYDSDSDRPRIAHIDVRYVVSVVEHSKRRAYGANNDVATIRLHDGHEYCVTDYQRDSMLRCRERDYEVTP